MHSLKVKLVSCLRLLDCGEPNHFGDINWLNDFCAEFLEFLNMMQQYICNKIEHDSLEIICLCLSQIMICIRHLEHTIQTEAASGLKIQASHNHFVDRISVCLKRLCVALTSVEAEGTQDNTTEGVSFLKLLDFLLDSLSEFTIDNEERSNNFDSPAEMLVLGKQIKIQIDLLLGQALSFANVALQQDKKALSALCQKVMRDCRAFEEECQLNPTSPQHNSSEKLRAVTLEQALHQLEEYMNEALLRLVYTCFLDFQRISVDKIRTLLRSTCAVEETESAADDLIADFDVNLDRATQIGIFAIAFAPSLQTKTTVRSCLASFEYLDTSLIPSLYGNAADLHSELLEQHFKEEMSKLKKVLHEIMDSRAFVGCYLQILNVGINAAEKKFDKSQLDDLVLMGFSVLEHFQLDVNLKVLLEKNSTEHLQNFVRILRECKAILMCAAQVQPDRIIKRFKILRTILRKLHSSIMDDPYKPNTANEHSPLQEVTNTSCIDEDNPTTSLMASPSRSILYGSRKNRSKTAEIDYVTRAEKTLFNYLQPKRFNCIRRKQSLRTNMFKRQTVVESFKMQYSTNSPSASLEISEILDQLTSLTSSFSKSLSGRM